MAGLFFFFFMLNNGKEVHEDFVFHRTLESMATQMYSYVLGIDFANLGRCSFFGTHSINSVCNFYQHFFTGLSRYLWVCFEEPEGFLQLFPLERNFWGTKVLFTCFAWSCRGSCHYYKVVTMTTTNKNVLWDTNWGLAGFNLRLTNRPTNLALDNAILTPG